MLLCQRDRRNADTYTESSIKDQYLDMVLPPRRSYTQTCVYDLVWTGPRVETRLTTTGAFVLLIARWTVRAVVGPVELDLIRRDQVRAVGPHKTGRVGTTVKVLITMVPCHDRISEAWGPFHQHS